MSAAGSKPVGRSRFRVSATVDVEEL